MLFAYQVSMLQVSMLFAKSAPEESMLPMKSALQELKLFENYVQFLLEQP